MGWNTLRELSDKLDVSESTLLRRLRKLVREDAAEKKTFRIRLEKFHRDVVHYKLL